MRVDLVEYKKLPQTVSAVRWHAVPIILPAAASHVVHTLQTVSPAREKVCPSQGAHQI